MQKKTTDFYMDGKDVGKKDEEKRKYSFVC